MKKIKRWLDLSYIKRNFLVAACVGILICVFALAIQRIGLEGAYTKEVLTAIFSVVTSLLGLYTAYEANSRQNALQYITNKRFDWLRDIRSLTSKLCGKVTLAEIYFDEWKKEINHDEKRKNRLLFMKKYSEISEIMASLYLYYNLGGERDHILLVLLAKLNKELINMIKSIENNSDNCKESREKILKLLEDHTQVYLKLEWERIKNETKYIGNIRHRSHFIKKKMIKQRLSLYEKKSAFDRGIKDIEVDDLYIENVKNIWKEKQIL